MGKWHLIQNQQRLREIFKEPPFSLLPTFSLRFLPPPYYVPPPSSKMSKSLTSSLLFRFFAKTPPWIEEVRDREDCQDLRILQSINTTL